MESAKNESTSASSGATGPLIPVDPPVHAPIPEPPVHIPVDPVPPFPLSGNPHLVVGTSGNETLQGLLNAHNVILAGTGNDVLIGGNLSDVLVGGKGDDTFMGGKGNDVLIAGQGHDTFVFAHDGNHSTIVNYQPALDHIRLEGFTAKDVSFTGGAHNDLVMHFGDGAVTFHGLHGTDAAHVASTIDYLIPVDPPIHPIMG